MKEITVLDILNWENELMAMRTSEEGLEERDVSDYVLKIVEFVIGCDEWVWSGSIGWLMEVAAIKGVTLSTFSKFLAQHSVCIRLRGVAYNKKHTSAGQVITLEEDVSEESKGNEGCARI